MKYIYIVLSRGFSEIHLFCRQEQPQFVRAFSLPRSESSIHTIGWWFEKYSAKTDCLSCHAACRWQTFRPANPQQYESVRGAQQTCLYPRRDGCSRLFERSCLSWWGLPPIWKYWGSQVRQLWPFTAPSSFLILYGRSLFFSLAQYCLPLSGPWFCDCSS